jgi:hypothetical protein
MTRRITGLKEMACEFHATSFGFGVVWRAHREDWAQNEVACGFHTTSFSLCGFHATSGLLIPLERHVGCLIPCHRYRRKPPSQLLNTSGANKGTMWISCCPIVKKLQQGSVWVSCCLATCYAWWNRWHEGRRWVSCCSTINGRRKEGPTTVNKDSVWVSHCLIVEGDEKAWTRQCVVMCRLGLEALGRPKPALESWAKPELCWWL